MSCKFNTTTKAGASLKRKVGANSARFNEMVSAVYDEGKNKFKPEFVDWYRDYVNDHEIEPTLYMNNRDNKIADAIERFNQEKHFRVGDRTDSNSYQKEEVERYGYDSVSSKLFANKTVANRMIMFYRDDLDKGLTINKDELLSSLSTRAAKWCVVNLVKKYAKLTGEKDKTVLKQMVKELMFGGNNKDTYLLNIDKAFNKKDVDYQDKNNLALYKDMFSSAGCNVYFDNVIKSNPILGKLGFKTDSVSDEQTYLIQDEESVEDSDNRTNEDNDILQHDELDVNSWDDHSGLTSSYVKGIDDNVKIYLSLVPKLTENVSIEKINKDGKKVNTYTYDLNNALNAVDYLDYKSVYTTIASKVKDNCDNLKGFINAIREASNIKGMEGLIKVVDDITANPDLAQKLRREFRYVIDKYDARIQVDGDTGDNTVTGNRTNNTTSNEQVYTLRFLNDAKYSMYSMTDSDTMNLIDDIKKENRGDGLLKRIANLAEHPEDLNGKAAYNKVVSLIADKLKQYYPSLDKDAVETYIRVTNSDIATHLVDNIKVMLEALRSAANINATVRTNVNRTNDRISALRVERNRLDTETDKARIDNINNEIAKAYQEDPMPYEDINKATKDLAVKLSPYSVIRIDLNSRTSTGNLQSDLINSSMITYLLSVLNSDATIKDAKGNVTHLAMDNFAKQKFQNCQYNLSNILVESTDDKGRIINYGLFRYDAQNNKYVETSYARHMLNIGLFNGVSKVNTKEGLMYSAMSKADYVYTAYSMYHRSANNIDAEIKTEGANQSIQLATYFMRTPSDAPKTFNVRTAKYDTIGLRTVTNKQAIEDEIRKKVISSVDYQTLSDFKNRLINKNIDKKWIKIDDEKIDKQQMIDDLLSSSIRRRVYDNQLMQYNKEEGTATIGYKVDFKDVDNPDYYVISGNLVEVNGRKYIENGKATLIKTTDNRKSSIGAILMDKFRQEAYRTGSINGINVEYSINTDHPVFKQFRRIFDQELINMAEFIGREFKRNENGIICRYTREDVIDKFGLDKDAKLNEEQQSLIGKPIFKDDAMFTDDEAGNRLCYKLYHIGKDNNSFLERVKGKWTLTGNMFHSNKFTITNYEDGTEINYGQDILNDFFGGLYGENTNDIPFDLVGDKVQLNFARRTDIDLDKEINNRISKFINDYINSSLNRFDEFKNIDYGDIINDDNVIDFTLNYRLALTSFDDLFEGDTKFYKSSQDFLKRAKEGQASGVIYSNYDVTQDLTQPIVNVADNLSSLEHHKDKLKELGLDVHQRTGFVGCTIKNTIRTSKECAQNGPIVKKLAKIYEKQGYNADEALAMANEHMAGYQGTKVNDAQSYITFEEWIRRIAGRGQLNEYMPLIEAIQTGKPITPDNMKKFVQVQKNFYYDQYYDSITHTYAPRQIKNAEFVLIPQLIKGTQLETVYNLMKKHGIDQLNTVETSKAGKARILTLFDETTGDVTKDNIEDFEKNIDGFKENFWYNFLYTQQETPQHLNAENKAGIQIMKKILDNITEFTVDANGNEVRNPLYDKKKEFTNLYVRNIQESFNEVAKELNIKLNDDGSIKTDENGNIEGIDMDVFFKKLRRECLRQGLDTNMLEYFTLDAIAPRKLNGRPNTIMDTFMSNSISKSQSVCQSLFNSAITRQTLPGFHAAQITNVGFKSNGEQVSYSKELRYHPMVKDENGKESPANYIEIMLPKANFGFAKDENGDYIRLEGETDEELNARLLKQLQDQKIDTIIGYRIPTEGKQSICAMKVVGFVDDAYGSTIVVPDDWVSQTGSDFDIDSVYGIQFATTINADGEIQKVLYNDLAGKSYDDYVKSNLNTEAKEKLQSAIKEGVNETTALANVAQEYGLQSREEFSKGKDLSGENSRNARNNRMLECMLDILQSDDAFEENTGQSQFRDLIEARDKIMKSKVKTIRANRSCYDFIDQAEFQEDVMSGAKLKAFSVTRDTFCSVCNTVRPKIGDNYQITIKYNNKDNKELAKRFGKDNVTSDNVVTHTMFGYSYDNHNVDGKILTAYSSETTAHILDAVKEGAIPNVNEFTFAVYKTFADIGSNYETTCAFIMHPAVKRIVDAYNANKSLYSEDSSKPIEEAFRSLAKDAGIDISNLYSTKDIIAALNNKFGKDYKYNKNNRIVIDAEKLAQQINDNPSLADEFDVLMAYNDINRLAQGIQSLVRVSNPDRFGAKQSIFATNEVFERISDIAIDEGLSSMFVTDKGKSFIDAVYPGVVDEYGRIDKEKYLANKEESAYPSLNAFLKYASTTSSIINSMLFDTQTPEFVDTVKSLERAFNIPRRINEKEYNEFEKYIISSVYNNTPFVKYAWTYKLDDTIPFTGRLEPLSSSNADDFNERARLYGYNQLRNLNDVKIEHKTKPTQEEVDKFASLSPARKVLWLQANCEDAGIFNHIKVDTYDTYRVGTKEQPAQNIVFDDDNLDSETAYTLFETAINDSNPFIKLAALDLIKYSFVVEGYVMRRNAINKIVKNSVLRNKELFGKDANTSIMDMIRTSFDNVLDNDYVRNYVRGHSDATFITHKKVYKHKVNNRFVEDINFNYNKIPGLAKFYIPELVETREDDNVHNEEQVNEESNNSRPVKDITLNDDEKVTSDLGLASRYGIVDKASKRVTPYIVFTRKIGNEYKDVLYATRQVGDTVYAYPLNKLRAGENSRFSIDNSNNFWASDEFYNYIIEDSIGKDLSLINSTNEEDTAKVKELYNDSKSHNRVAKVKYNHDVDIARDMAADNGGAKDAYNKIVTLADANEVSGMIQNAYLYERIGHKSKLVILDINGTPRKVQIKRARTTDHGRSLNVPHDSVVITFAKDKPKTDNFLSSIEDYGFDAYKDVSRRAAEGDVVANKELDILRRSGFEGLSSDFSTKELNIYDSVSRYVRAKSKSLISDATQFVKDDEGHYHSMFDAETIERIKNDPALQRRFLKIILDTDAILNKYGEINDVITDEDTPKEIEDYIKNIKDAITNLQNKINISNLNAKFAREVVAKWSNDPNIQNGLIDICNGFHPISIADAWIGDTQDAGNSLTQIVSKVIMSDIRTKEMQADRDATDFHKKMKAIEAKGAIDWSKLVDKDGRLIQDFNEQFEADLARYRNAYLKARTNAVENVAEYIKAKHEWDKFKLDYINQKFDDSYYRRHYELDDKMIKENHYIFEEYTRLKQEMYRLNTLRDNGVLSEDNQAKYDNVRAQISELTSNYDPNTGQFKPQYDSTNPIPGAIFDRITGERIGISDEEKYRKAVIGSYASAEALKKYIDAKAAVEADYVSREARDGFDEQLNKMLDVINEAENRDAYGFKQATDDELKHNKRYQEAKAWVAQNTVWHVDKEVTERIRKAYSVLSQNNTKGKHKTSSAKIAAIARIKREGKSVYDMFGNIDGSLFTEAEQEAIRKQEQSLYSVTSFTQGNETMLINEAPAQRKVYPSKFYQLITNNGGKNQEWLKLANEINSILRPYYDTTSKTININNSDVPIEKKKEDLLRLKKLYAKLRETKKTVVTGGNNKGISVAKFIRLFTVPNYNWDRFNEEHTKAKNIGGEYLRLWEDVNMEYEPELDEKGRVVLDYNGNMQYDYSHRVPNRFIYGILTMNEEAFFKAYGKSHPEYKKEMIDKTDALSTVLTYLENTTTPEYTKALREASAKGEEEFKKWYDRNHVWNVYSHRFEPISIWSKTRIIPKYANGTYTPAYSQTESVPVDDSVKNHDYKEGANMAANYKKGNTYDDRYDNKVELNDAEKEARELMTDTLNKIVRTTKGQRFINNGFIPLSPKEAKQDLKWWAKQGAELVGWNDYFTKMGAKDLFTHMNYSTDISPDMPMLVEQFRNEASKNIEEIKALAPKRSDFEDNDKGEEEYNKAVKEHEARLAAAEKANAEIHQSMIDRDFVSAMMNFIKLAGHYNAVQDNKYLFYYTQNMIKNIPVYENATGFSSLKKDSSKSTKDVTKYSQNPDTRLYDLWTNWGNRLIYDRYKLPNNKLTKAANIMQSLTSAKFMMFNITGGIGNVTVGRASIFGEHIAKEFVGTADWEAGKRMWYANTFSFLAGLNSETSTSLADAIVKAMNVVDFDEVLGRPKGNFKASDFIKRLNDLAYSPNAMGEHHMQNSMMFAMMYSNRLVPVDDYKAKGRAPYETMTFAQYKNKVNEMAIRQVIAGTPLAKAYEEFIKDIKSDDNKLKDYARGRKDLATEFKNIYLNNKQSKEFVNKIKELEKDLKKKFEEMPTLMSQLDLKDGKLGFKDGSLMSELEATSANKEVNDALRILGEFKGKVISVNKEIHGVYDRLGAAQLEKYFCGSLIMQYHKHIYPGILKHWRRQGYFNEERGHMTVGCAPALMDFLSMPIRQLKDRKKYLTDAQLETLEGTQNLFKAYVNFAQNLGTNWNSLSDYQRAAIRRAAGDVIGVLAALCVGIATRIAWDDDKLKDSNFANLMLYEADSLAAQSMMFNPAFVPGEFKTLWSSPVASLTGPNDIYDALNLISSAIMDDDFDWDYTTGRYKGQNKFAVKLTKNIPMYRAYTTIADMNKANSYYHRGDNMLTVIPIKNIADDIAGR